MDQDKTKSPLGVLSSQHEANEDKNLPIYVKPNTEWWTTGPLILSGSFTVGNTTSSTLTVSDASSVTIGGVGFSGAFVVPTNT